MLSARIHLRRVLSLFDNGRDDIAQAASSSFSAGCESAFRDWTIRTRPKEGITPCREITLAIFHSRSSTLEDPRGELFCYVSHGGRFLFSGFSFSLARFASRARRGSCRDQEIQQIDSSRFRPPVVVHSHGNARLPLPSSI